MGGVLTVKRWFQRLIRYHILHHHAEEALFAWRMSQKMRVARRLASLGAIPAEGEQGRAPDASIFRAQARIDRSGAQVHEDLMAYSFCFHRGYVYGGSVGEAFFEEHLRLCRLVGLPDPQRAGQVSLVADFFREVQGHPRGEAPPRVLSGWPRFLALLFRIDIDEERLLDVDQIYSVAFRRHLREATRFGHDGRARPRAVVHVRRGDISRGQYRHRYLDNSYYLDLIGKITRAWPGVEVVVHSERDSPDSFDEFEAVGCLLKLDAPLEAAWEDMATADVLVLSKSSFSYVPALFNPNVVLYTPFWHAKLGDWVDVSVEDVEAVLRARRSA